MNNNTNNRHGGERRQPQRGISREQAINAEQKRMQAIRRKKKRKQLMDKAVAIFILSLVGLALSLVVIFGCIFWDFSKHPDVPSYPLKVTIGDEEPIVFDKNNYFYRDGEYYISLNRLSEISDFTIHGNATNSVTLSTSNNNSVTFDIGSCVFSSSDFKSLMTGTSYFEKDMFFIPVSFFTTYFDGVSSEYNSKGSQRGFNVIFSDSFRIKHSDNAEAQSIAYERIEDKLTTKKPVFISDLSKYEMYMNPEDRDEYLYLINEQHPLGSEYIPSDLHDVLYTRGDRAKQKMRLYAAMSLEAMFIEMRANGFTDVSVTSGYRSYAYQSQLFNGRLQNLIPTYGEEGAYARVKQGTAVPGTSEHQSGLCADLHNLPAASEAFAAEDAYRWLYSNCADFGFILRYPKNKTDITGIMFEPWHYRFVGRYHAKKIMDSGVCLEEYMESIG